ncbi:MAG: hypothetical protein M1814_001843 [Vezdaea aestivalis]|nr:MAG: hypothetical protein M1814_001843 [Vezdaea aestivalis]
MDTLQLEQQRLAKKASLSKTVDEVQVVIDELQQARDFIANGPQSDDSLSSTTMRELQSKVELSFDKIGKDLADEISSAHKKYRKALDKRFRATPLETSGYDALAARPALINRAIAMHLLREGQFSVAAEFLAEAAANSSNLDRLAPLAEQSLGDSEHVSISPESLQEQFAEMYRILDDMKTRGSLLSAIGWAKAHRRDLELRGSTLEFELNKLQYIWLFNGPDASTSLDAESRVYEALAYAQANFNPFQEKHQREIQQLAAGLAFMDESGQSPYAHVFGSPSIRDEVADSFTREFCSLLGLSPDSPLFISTTAGAIALPSLIKVATIMKSKRTEWTTQDELPALLCVMNDYPPKSEDDDDDEYGDFDEYDTQVLTEFVAGLNLNRPPVPPPRSLTSGSEGDISSPPQIRSVLTNPSRRPKNAIPTSDRVLRSSKKATFTTAAPEVQVYYDESDSLGSSSAFLSAESREVRTARAVESQKSADPPPENDTRSPIEKFRSGGRRALRVTDFTSPTWCEIQFANSLETWGRVPQTQAMKQGTAVHSALEEQVHRIVQITTETKEDDMGRRLWNVIQGLQCLRQSGLARELEVWGVLDGQVVIGIIDELSVVCPDQALEEEAMERAGQIDSTPPLPDQLRITDYLQKPADLDGKTAASREQRRLKGSNSKVYIGDVKTRMNGKMPPAGKSNRGTVLQLMLYRKLLATLADGGVDSEVLWKHFKVDADMPFTDSFIAQIGSMNEVFFDAETDPSPPGSQETGSYGSLDLLLSHNSLNKLWKLVKTYYALTFPGGESSVGEVLIVNYRRSDNGEPVGASTFLHNEDLVTSHINDELRWWRGQRKARGVEVEEAFKCGSCNFYDDCDWRQEKIRAAAERQRSRKAGLGPRSVV